MKIKFILSILAIALISFAQGQKTSADFSSSSNVKDLCADNIKSTIKTQGDNTVDYLADSILLMDYSVEIAQSASADGTLSPNARLETTVSMYVPETDYVCIKITDMKGRTIISSRRLLESGTHFFKYEPGVGKESFFNAYWHGKKNSIKIEHASSSQNQPISLEYLGNPSDNPNFKLTPGVNSDHQDTHLYSGKKRGL